MNRRSFVTFVGGAALFLSTSSLLVPSALARHERPTLVVTMTNDPAGNQVKVYDATTLALLQTRSTNGSGGVSGNARGVRQYNGEIVAAVNNGSNSVAVFRRTGDRLRLDSVVATSSAPVSIDFGNGHMYVAGATTVDSFKLRGNGVGPKDGTATLRLAGGGAPPAGSTAQVGVVDERTLLVTLKTDPTPGTVNVVALHDGAIVGVPPTAVSAPDGTLTPFGFAVYPDGTAVITLAHSNHDGLFRDGAFRSTIAAGQGAPCWITRLGKYMFTANTGSRTISRLLGTGNNVFVDSLVAANIPTGGGPTDIDAEVDLLAVIDRVSSTSHLSLFAVNEFGELSAPRSVDLAAASANGVAILSPAEDDD